MILSKPIKKEKIWHFQKQRKIMTSIYKKMKLFKYICLLANIIIILILILSKKNIVNSNEQIILKDYCPISKQNLKKYPKNKNHRLILKERYDFFKYFSKCAKRKITRIKSIFISYRYNFGNQLIFLNKVIFFC